MRNQSIVAAISAYRAEALRVARWESARRLTAGCSFVGFLILFKIPVFAILTIAVFFVAFYWRFLRKTKRPGLTSTARRLESLCPGATGILAGAVDLEREENPNGSPELRRLTSELAQKTLETRVAAIPKAERSFAILGRSVDAASLARRRRVELGWTATSACLVAALAATSAVRFFAKEVESPKPEVESVSDATQERRTPPAPTVPPERVGETESKTYASVAAALGALCATLERLETLATELSAEEDVQSAIKLAREIEYYVESESDGAIVRTKQTLDLTRDAASIRGSADERISGRDAAAFLLARRLVSLESFLETTRKTLKKELFETLGTLLRDGDATRRSAARRDVARLAGAFARRVGDERRAASNLAFSWDFGERLDAFDESRRALLREAVENLAARPGVSEWDEEADPRARAGFIERLGDLRGRLSELDALLRARAAILQQEENADFVEFVRETTTASGVFDLFFRETSVRSATRSVETRRVTLDQAATNAGAERWGLVARALDERGDGRGVAESDEDVEPGDALAAFLAWGARREADWDGGADSAQTSPVKPREFSGKTTDPELSEEVAPDADVASDTNVASGLALSATASDAAPDSKRIRSTRELTTGDLFAGGSSPDFGFVGGAEGKGEPAAPTSGGAFVAELPKLTRERLERSQEWTPDAETAERTERFRENLRRRTLN